MMLGSKLQLICSPILCKCNDDFANIFCHKQISTDGSIKLADVGLTKAERDISGTRCGTACYSAPEVLEGLEYGKPADIYSLGIIVWELWYGRPVKDELSTYHKGDVEAAVRSGIRPSLIRIHEPPDPWKTFMKQCWSHNVKNRPSAVESYNLFDDIEI